MAVKNITTDYYDYIKLVESANAFEKIKKNEKFIHIKTYYSFNGTYTEITSNDDRVRNLKDDIIKSYEETNNALYGRIKSLEGQNERLKSMGLFKRIFSWR